MSIALNEAIGVTDIDTLLNEELYADNAGITDTTSIVKAVNASLADSISGSDVLTTSYQTNASQGLPENVGATDAVTLLRATTKTTADTANLSDAIALVRAMPKSLSESVGITDSVSAVKNANASFTVLLAGNAEAPLTLQGWWSGTAIVPVTYDQKT
jgi:hypothetical protein